MTKCVSYHECEYSFKDFFNALAHLFLLYLKYIKTIYTGMHLCISAHKGICYIYT